MYTIDGICYAGEFHEGIKVAEARLLPGRMMLVTFSTGEKRLFDATTLTGGAFEPLFDEEALGDFSIFHGVMTWLGGEIDIAPEAMCRDSLPYSGEAARRPSPAITRPAVRQPRRRTAMTALRAKNSAAGAMKGLTGGIPRLPDRTRLI